MAKANRYRRPIDAKTHVAGRELLRYFLGNYLGSDPVDLRFEYGSQGKPRLAEGKLQFNISHAGDLALMGLSRQRALGVGGGPRKQAYIKAGGRNVFREFGKGSVSLLPGEKTQSD